MYVDKEEPIKHKTEIRYFVQYTLSFIIISLLVFLPFIIYKKSFIKPIDGIRQHYIALMYYGKWLRSIVKGVLSGSGVTISLWDYSIGYGNDVLTTFNYYCLGDPLALLSVFVRAKHTIYLFNTLVILRMYLAGLFFSMFCLRHRKSTNGTLCASLVYALCGWMIIGATRHPFFGNAEVYFPLLLMGFDKVFDGDSPLLFILSVCVSAMSNFYFFYMLVIILVCYALIRFFTTPHHKKLREFLSLLGRCTLFGCIGVALASVLFCPIVLVALNSPRSSDNTIHNVLYNHQYYKQALASFITTDADIGYWRIQSYSSPALIAVFALFARKDKWGTKIAFIVLAVSFLVPAVGNALNGFKYASNRWSWAFSAVVAYIIADEWEDILQPSKHTRAFITISCVGYFLVSLFFIDTWTEGYLASCVIVFIALCFILLSNDTDNLHKVLPHTMSIIVLSGIVLNGYYSFDINQRNYVEGYMDLGDEYSQVMDKYNKRLAELTSSNAFTRYERQNNGVTNAAVITGGHSTESYWSLNDPRIIHFMNDMEMGGKWLPSFYHNLDGRSYLEKIASVGFYLSESQGQQPYGFEYVESLGSKSIYVDKSTLPFGYTYDSYLDQSEYQKLPAYEKQQALIQAVVLDSDVVSTLPMEMHPANIEFSTKLHEVEIETGDNVRQIDEEHYLVSKGGASLKLTFEGEADCETYVHIEGLNFEHRTQLDLCTGDIATDDQRGWFNSLSLIDQQRIRVASANTGNETNNLQNIRISGNKRSREITYTTPYNSFAKSQSNFISNLGYSEKPLHEASVTLPAAGIYTIKRIEVVCQPIDKLNAYCDKLCQNTLEDVITDTNTISGNISLEQSKILCLSIPYSEGWSAKVDGKEVDLFVANTIFTGMLISPGNHHIELSYRTHGLVAGGVLSGIGIIMLVVIVVRYRSVDSKR